MRQTTPLRPVCRMCMEVEDGEGGQLSDPGHDDEPEQDDKPDGQNGVSDVTKDGNGVAGAACSAAPAAAEP